MRTTKTTPVLCPTCGATITAATDLRGHAEPRAGDLSVCLACGGVLVFTEDLSLRRATRADARDLPPAVRRQVLLTAAAVKLTGPPPPDPETEH
jgi:hypothetical protein